MTTTCPKCRGELLSGEIHYPVGRRACIVVLERKEDLEMSDPLHEEVARLRAEVERLRADLQAVAKYLLGISKSTDPLRCILIDRETP